MLTYIHVLTNGILNKILMLMMMMILMIMIMMMIGEGYVNEDGHVNDNGNDNDTQMYDNDYDDIS